MGYSTGMMKYRVQVAKRATDESASFGKSGQPKYEILGTFWMGETFNKGVKAMREGALDAYDVVMIRMRWRDDITRDWRIVHDGKTYEIESLHSSREKNEVQITAHEVAG